MSNDFVDSFSNQERGGGKKRSKKLKGEERKKKNGIDNFGSCYAIAH